MSEEKTLMDYVKEAKSQIEEIEINQVVELLDDGYQVLDVREPAEYHAGTIDGAFNLPRGLIEAACDKQFAGKNSHMQDREKKWLTFCATSGRAAMAAKTLKEMGFKNIKNINGGMAAWKSAEMQVVIPPEHQV